MLGLLAYLAFAIEETITHRILPGEAPNLEYDIEHNAIFLLN